MSLNEEDKKTYTVTADLDTDSDDQLEAVLNQIEGALLNRMYKRDVATAKSAIASGNEILATAAFVLIHGRYGMKPYYEHDEQPNFDAAVLAVYPDIQGRVTPEQMSEAVDKLVDLDGFGNFKKPFFEDAELDRIRLELLEVQRIGPSLIDVCLTYSKKAHDFAHGNFEVFDPIDGEDIPWLIPFDDNQRLFDFSEEMSDDETIPWGDLEQHWESKRPESEESATNAQSNHG